jgi:hypothetical protein
MANFPILVSGKRNAEGFSGRGLRPMSSPCPELASQIFHTADLISTSLLKRTVKIARVRGRMVSDFLTTRAELWDNGLTRPFDEKDTAKRRADTRSDR